MTDIKATEVKQYQRRSMTEIPNLQLWQDRGMPKVLLLKIYRSAKNNNIKVL